MKTKIKTISALLVLVLIVSSFSGAGIKHASAAGNAPEILITEIVPKSQDNDDPYEYIELFNTSDVYVELKNYKFLNPNIDITSSNVIPPKGTMVVCMRSNTSLDSFNRFYGTNLTINNFMTLSNSVNALIDNTTQNICLAKDDSTIVSMAKYDVQDFGLKQAVTYKYPETGYDMVKLGRMQSPSPGTVTPDQVPDLGIRVQGITLAKSSAVMQVGNNMAITATITPATATNKSITWTSSDTNVAVVNANGIVTAKSSGTVVITATTVDGGFKATCTITVASVPVTGITLDKTLASIRINQPITLKATVIPDTASNKQVVWTSSNTGIATVDNNGVVIGKSAGTAVITAKTVDGNFSATCTVTVSSDIYIAVTGVSLDKKEMTIEISKTSALTATVSPENAENKNVTWKTSDANIAVVDANGVVQAKAVGNATITVTTVEGNYSASCAVTVSNTGSDSQSSLSIKMNKSTLQLKDHQKYTLKVIVTPGVGRVKEIIWESSNTSVAVVDSNGTVTPKGSGTAIITASTSDKKLSCKCTVTVNMDKSKGKGKK